MKNSKKIITFSPNSKFEDSHIYKLSQLKPAGTKLILEPNVELIELLKLTLFDLILKQVLIIKKSLRKAHPKDLYLREYIIIETGKNFAKYKSNQFEKYFTKIIDEESYYQLKPYLKTIFKEISSNYKYKKQIINDLKINNLFKIDLISIIFSRIKTNIKGTILKKNITKYLTEVDENIADLIYNNPNKALELILFLQGNIFLLKNLKFELLEKLKTISTIGTSDNNENYDDLVWIDFIDDFDSSVFDLIPNISEIFDSTDEYFDFNSDGDWSDHYDFD